MIRLPEPGIELVRAQPVDAPPPDLCNLIAPREPPDSRHNRTAPD
jgi:hypothetical protein